MKRVKADIIPMPRAADRPSVVVLADGDYPSTALLKQMLKQAERVVCCDGAAMEFVARGGVPFAIVGDCDSLTLEFKERYAALLHIDEDQENNDLTKAVRFCLSQGLVDIVILGATGKREDHTIGNIALLADYAKLPTLGTICIITNQGIFDPISSDANFESFCGQYVSIFTIDTQAKITTEKLQYPLHNASLNSWWQGTLNRSLGPVFGIKTDGKTIVYRLFEGANNK